MTWFRPRTPTQLSSPVTAAVPGAACGTCRRWTKGTVVRRIPLEQPREAIAPGSHPTALLLSPDEQLLYVALSNVDKVVVLSTADAGRVGLLDTKIVG